MCARRMQNRMGLFSTATKLFVWRLRLKVQKHSHSSLEIGCSMRKICWPTQISGISLDTELSDDKDIQRQLRYQYCAANKLRASFSRCSNAVKNVLFRSFCTPMYASQLWCNFRKSCMQRLRVAYNFGCRALYNLPWRASVSSHQVQCNIPTFEALLRKYKYLFQKDAESLTTYGYVFWCSQIVCTRHYSLNTIIAFYAVNEWSNFAVVRLIDGMTSHNAFAFYLDSPNLGIGTLLRSTAVTSVTCYPIIVLRMCL